MGVAEPGIWSALHESPGFQGNPGGGGQDGQEGGDTVGLVHDDLRVMRVGWVSGQRLRRPIVGGGGIGPGRHAKGSTGVRLGGGTPVMGCRPAR
jgi:hypothetical protein